MRYDQTERGLPLPRRIVSRWLRSFADKHNGGDETLDGLKNIGHLLGFNAIFMGSFFYSSESLFSWVPQPSMIDLWHIRPFGLGVWDVMFFIVGLWLIISTLWVRGVFRAHIFASLVWFVMGAVWVAYSFVYQPSYVFGIGVLSIFISAQHLIYARLWKAEGVE